MQRRPNKNKQKMAINLCDLANILDKIVLSEHWKWLFRASRFQHVLKGKKPQTHLVAHPRALLALL